ncbi:putative multidrug resistance protein 1, 2 [Xylariales sp. PMI_506]|nr:putative multidrug resistance protein 1, 2 [Xylariales sp. PMI_506]
MASISVLGGEVPSKKEQPALSESDTRIIEEQLHVGNSKAGFLAIFRYATHLDLLCIFASIIACSAGGVMVPLMMVVLGSVSEKFSGRLATLGTDPDFVASIEHNVLYFVYIGVAQLILVTAGMYGLNYSGERITKKLRQAFLAAVLRQNVAFFDSTRSGEITVRISNDMNLVQDGISQKVGLVASGVAGFLAALIIAFVENWRLAFVLLCIPILFILIMGTAGNAMMRYQEKAANDYAQSSSFAGEVLSCIRNVVAFGSQKRFTKVYEKSLASPEKSDFAAQGTLGFLMSTMFAMVNLGYGLSFWQGNRFLEQGYGTVGKLLTTMFASGMAGTLLGQAAPHLAALTQAGASASRIFALIERHSPIDSSDDSGQVLENVLGGIEFRGIKMVYPSRADQVILERFNLSIPAGKTVAIVGPSGSGKSTILSLVERLYLPLRGEVRLDGVPINELNLRWLRSQIGIVSQDNFLFDTTIFENIAYGLGPEYNGMDRQAVVKRVYEAARIANAHDFIQEFPSSYATRVGDRGSRLSGGQRQRIAIARAIISDPGILMLDEATAALDTQSEALVQEALFSAAQGRTTIIVAHRLSTIRRADMIVVMDKGRVTESGTHTQLMAAQSTYASLVRAQRLSQGTQRREQEQAEVYSARTRHLSQQSGVALMDEDVGQNQNAAQAPIRRKSLRNLVSLVWSINKPEKYYLILGLCCSLVAGSALPVTGILFGNALISITNPELSNGEHSLNFWCAMFLMLGLVLLVAYGVQGFTFAHAGARLGSRARKLAFASMLRQDISFFAQEENRPDVLTAFLSTEATKLRGIGGATLGSVMNSIMGLVGGIAVSCSFGWKLGLVSVACMPILLLCGFLNFYVINKSEKRLKRTTTAAAKAGEAISAINTVASLAMEQTIIRQYEELLTQDYHRNLMYDLGASMTYALSQALVVFVNALLFWYGGTKLISTGEYTIRQFFICYVASAFGAQVAGTIFSFAPEVSGAQDAAANLKYLLESKPNIEATAMPDDNDDEHDQLSGEEKGGSVHGDIKIKSVVFSYPTSPDHRILAGVNLEAHKGQLVALVGSSGSGKSTIMSLLERFYDPVAGAILIDRKGLHKLNLRNYRKQVALVEQESPLVGGTIRECLLSDDESITDDMIERACRDANILDFVLSLPEGLNTLVGARGNRVSGGQRQRLAIAKALLRNPKILLLDEATSALDSESEKLVQHTLDAVSSGRTTVAIAHRLSSITHADYIYVFDHGRIVEKGTHQELIEKRGRYFELVLLQDMGK